MRVKNQCLNLGVKGLKYPAMCYKEFVDYIIPVVGLIISILACLFTFLTYKKSRDILEVVNEERNYRWNRCELENLFSTIPIDSLESFFQHPDIIRDELWEGLRAIDLSTFQYNGKERDLIVNFIGGLDSFCGMRYKKGQSGHWKFQPLAENDPFSEDKENEKMKELHAKVGALRPLFIELKKTLLKYHVNIRDVNRKAYEYFNKKKEEQQKLYM